MRGEPDGREPAAQAGPILVVEDEPGLRQAIAWTLQEAGMAVQTASDGQQALVMAQLTRPAVVVLDVNLPTLRGGGVAAGLRASLGESLPILVITANEHVEAIAEHVHAYAYLAKPFEMEALLAAVRQGLTST